jgi:calcium channel MID1
MVYISVTMGTQSTADSQLTLFVSQTIQNPGPTQQIDQQQVVTLDGGLASIAINANSPNVFIGISAPNANPSMDWMFSLGASNQSFVHMAQESTSLGFVLDTDSNAALLSTTNLSDPIMLTNEVREQWLALNATPPFGILILDTNTDIDGVARSFCGLSQLTVGNLSVTTGMSTRNLGANPKQDFYVQGLQPGTTYQAIMTFNGSQEGSNTLGGSMVWKPFEFTTKSGKKLVVVFTITDSFRWQLPNHLRSAFLFRRCLCCSL